MDRKKILYLINSLGPAGAERVLLDLAKGLDKGKYEPVLIYFEPVDSLSSEFKQAGVRTECLGHRGKLDYRIAFDLFLRIRQIAPDLIHCHLPYANILGRLSGRLAGCQRIVCTEHNVSSSLHRVTFLVDRLTIPLSSKVTCVSEGVERSFFGTSQILECGNHNLMRRSYTIYNGVNVNQIVSVVNEINQDEVRTQFGAKSDDFVIGIVARLIRWKGHQELIRAVHLAVKQNTSIKLWIIGWGELEENLKSLTESLELDHHVAFLGKQGNVYSILKGMDLFVLPYYYKGLFKGEGVGIAILEAMSAGLPIISTRVPGIERAVLSGKTGFVVKQGDIQSLCDKILWMKNYPAEKHRMGMEAQRWVKNHYSLETMVKRYEFLYEQLLRYSQ